MAGGSHSAASPRSGSAAPRVTTSSSTARKRAAVKAVRERAKAARPSEARRLLHMRCGRVARRSGSAASAANRVSTSVRLGRTTDRDEPSGRSAAFQERAPRSAPFKEPVPGSGPLPAFAALGSTPQPTAAKADNGVVRATARVTCRSTPASSFRALRSSSPSPARITARNRSALVNDAARRNEGSRHNPASTDRPAARAGAVPARSAVSNSSLRLRAPSQSRSSGSRSGRLPSRRRRAGRGSRPLCTARRSGSTTSRWKSSVWSARLAYSASPSAGARAVSRPSSTTSSASAARNRAAGPGSAGRLSRVVRISAPGAVRGSGTVAPP
ncbi:hypothetical protein SMICM17S_08172 [Streptomyces microflavus]